MSNGIKIMLNDKESIEELAKDPEVQIRIKDAIIDTIVKRTVKVLHDGIMAEVYKAITNTLEEIRSLKDKSLSDIIKIGAWNRPSLTDSFREEIRTEARNEMNLEVHRIVEEQKDEFGKEYRNIFERKKKKIEEYDFEKAVQRYISKRVSSVLLKAIAPDEENDQ